MHDLIGKSLQTLENGAKTFELNNELIGGRQVLDQLNQAAKLLNNLATSKRKQFLLEAGGIY